MGDAFIYKNEAKELARTREIERKRAEEAYNARVDKKECRVCHVAQTYAEFIKGEKRCERCNSLYRPKKTWSEVQDGFLQRLEEQQAAKVARLMETAKSMEAEEKGMAKDKKKHRKAKYWKTVGPQFLKRMEDDAAVRVANKKKISDVASYDPECTFQPKVHIP